MKTSFKWVGYRVKWEFSAENHVGAEEISAEQKGSCWRQARVPGPEADLWVGHTG